MAATDESRAAGTMVQSPGEHHVIDMSMRANQARCLIGLTCVVGFLVGSAGPGEAQPIQAWPRAGNQPAATLLLPYFEVDLENAGGLGTLFSVNNASAPPAIARVVVWTDLAVPVLGFNLYLEGAPNVSGGYDIESVSLRDVLEGTLPQAVSPSPVPGCDNPPLTPAQVAQLQAMLTGQPSPQDGQCGGRDFGSGNRIARGYVTIDKMNACTTSFPGDPGYFAAGGTGLASNDNILWGDYIAVDPARFSSAGEPLVHITASGTDPETSVAGQYTFYGRYVGWNASDNREPLSTTFAARYVNGGAKAEKTKKVFPPGTSFLVWRDTKLSYKSTSSTGTFACDATPAWYPLGIEEVVAWDEQEDAEDVSSGVSIPAAAQRVRVNGPDFPLSQDAGWTFLNLNTSVAPGSNPPEDDTAAQAWVGVEQNIQQNGRFLLGLRAIRLDSARDPRAP